MYPAMLELSLARRFYKQMPDEGNAIASFLKTAGLPGGWVGMSKPQQKGGNCWEKQLVVASNN